MWQQWLEGESTICSPWAFKQPPAQSPNLSDMEMVLITEHGKPYGWLEQPIEPDPAREAVTHPIAQRAEEDAKSKSPTVMEGIAKEDDHSVDLDR